MLKKLTIGLCSLITVMLSACMAGDKEAKINDMQIAHIAYTAGQIDIRYAHLALAISENKEVRHFAEVMLRDHAAVNEAALGLLDKLGASPENNPTSQSLLNGADEKIEMLRALDGESFDKAYARNELSYHQFVNKTVEHTFIPAAKNEEFKALLGVALKTFQVHEGHAEKLVGAL